MNTEQMLLSAVMVLGSAITGLFGLLYKLWSRHLRDTERRLKKCEDDRSEIWSHVHGLEKQIGELIAMACTDKSCGNRVYEIERNA